MKTKIQILGPPCWPRLRIYLPLKHVYYHMWNRSPVQVRFVRHGAQGWCTGTTQRDGMGREVGGGSGWGTHVHPWLIHVSVWQKPLQYCKVISLQLKYINKLKNKLIGENWHLYDTQCSNPGLSSTSSLICILTFFSVLFYNLQWSNLQTFSQTHFLIKFLKYLYIKKESTSQCRGHRFNSRSGRIPHAKGQLSLCATITEHTCLELMLCNKRSHCNKKPVYHNEE